MRTIIWQLVWVEDMPEIIEEGKIYISTKHRLTEHLCACGCGTEVSLPLGRSDWKIEYDGETVGIWPSVGNWRLPCKSHYVIQENKTRWCRLWSEKEILARRSKDREEKELYIKKRKRQRWWKFILRMVCRN